MAHNGPGYQEQRRPFWTLPFAVAALGTAVVMGWLALRADDPREAAGLAVTGLLAALSIALIAALGWRYRVTLEDDRLRFGYTGWSVELPLAEIESARVVRYRPLREFGGWGWRIGRGGRIGYIVHGAEGIELRRRAGRCYVFSCERPQQLLAELAGKGVVTEDGRSTR